MPRFRAAFQWPAYLRQQQHDARSARLQDFYRSQLFAPDLSLAEAEFVALDFETTGLNPKQDDIVSIGTVPFTLQRIRVAEAKQWLVRPQCLLSEDSIVVHGITHTDLDGAPDLDKILDELLDQLQGRIVVVHYHFIEREFLYQAVKKRRQDSLFFPMIDTMKLESDLHRQGWRGILKRGLGYKLTSIRLADSRQRYGLPRYQLHSAMVDALATAELLQAQIRHRFATGTKVADLWV